MHKSFSTQIHFVPSNVHVKHGFAIGHNESSLVAPSTPTTLAGLSYFPLPFFRPLGLYPPFFTDADVVVVVAVDPVVDPVKSVVRVSVSLGVSISLGASSSILFVEAPFEVVEILMVVVAAVPVLAVGLDEEPFFLLVFFFKRL